MRRCAATWTRGWRSSTSGQYRAIVLAYAGLRRLGLADRAALGDPDHAVGARRRPGRARDRVPQRTTTRSRALLVRLEHVPSRVCIEAERAFLHALGGDCHTPLAGHARLEPDRSRLCFDGVVGAAADDRMVRTCAERYTNGPPATLIEVGRELGREVAASLLAQGAAELIEDAGRRAAAARKTDPRARPH